MLLAKLPISQFFRMVYNSGSGLTQISEDRYELKIKGIANFLSIPRIDKLIKKIPDGVDVRVDLKDTKLVGITFMDYIVDYLKVQKTLGGNVVLEGLGSHVSYSTFNRALKISLKNSVVKLSPRQNRLKNLADERDYRFNHEVDWDTNYLKQFHFFEIRPIERKSNCLTGQFDETGVSWEISDVTFNEGDAFSAETFNTTLIVLKLNKKIPVFTMEKEGLFEKIFDRVMALTGYKDIDFEMYPDFSGKFLITGKNEPEIRSFFTNEIVTFFEKNHIYHIESNGEAIIIFDKIKLARTDETISLIDYGRKLVKLLN
jgi:hypothetical protein